MTNIDNLNKISSYEHIASPTLHAPTQLISDSISSLRSVTTDSQDSITDTRTKLIDKLQENFDFEKDTIRDSIKNIRVVLNIIKKFLDSTIYSEVKTNDNFSVNWPDGPDIPFYQYFSSTSIFSEAANTENPINMN